ncbi:MAG TPA: hypothetical protein RMI62_01595, partial [Polyangiaceae bacterium LLY-WYZ-15_(1-7)]|nr:hypothetical protein [Polyangiaceae bacterium LLY-WYZ-15_(1-7)]
MPTAGRLASNAAGTLWGSGFTLGEGVPVTSPHCPPLRSGIGWAGGLATGGQDARGGPGAGGGPGGPGGADRAFGLGGGTERAFGLGGGTGRAFGDCATAGPSPVSGGDELRR